MKNKTKIFLYRSCLPFVPFLENFCFLLSHNYSNIRFAIIPTIIMEDLLCRGSRIISYLPIYCLLMKCRMLFIIGYDRNVMIKVDSMEIVLISVLIYVSVLTQSMAHWYFFGKIPIIFINLIFIWNKYVLKQTYFARKVILFHHPMFHMHEVIELLTSITSTIFS